MCGWATTEHGAYIVLGLWGCDVLCVRCSGGRQVRRGLTCLERMADKTQNQNGCTLPDVENSTDAAVQLQSQVKLTAPAAVLTPGSPA
jgi:hypothetical protein